MPLDDGYITHQPKVGIVGSSGNIATISNAVSHHHFVPVCNLSHTYLRFFYLPYVLVLPDLRQTFDPT